MPRRAAALALLLALAAPQLATDAATAATRDGEGPARVVERRVGSVTERYLLVGEGSAPTAMLIGVENGAQPAASGVPARRPYRPGRTERISVPVRGEDTNGSSHSPVLSGDGSRVAFLSIASNLVEADTNGLSDVFLHDRRTGRTELVSVSSDEQQARDGVVGTASISRDGRYVTFASNASNLVEGDTNGLTDVFVRDVDAGTTERVSAGSGGVAANGSSYQPRISGDGRYVVFTSFASNLVDGFAPSCVICRDVYLHDRLTGTTEPVSVTPDGTAGNDSSSLPNVSADGRYVVFTSYATDLVASGVVYSPNLVYLRDRQSGTTELVSLTDGGTPANQGAAIQLHPDVSDDGRLVVWSSAASNLVPTDTNGWFSDTSVGSNLRGDVFLRNREAGTTHRVSVSSTGGEADGLGSSNQDPAISSDGRLVAFDSMGASITANDREPGQIWPDVYVRDLLTGETRLESRNSNGTQANSLSYQSVVSGDGRHIAFSSQATNLDPRPDTQADPAGPGDLDVFVRDLAPAFGLTGMRVSRGAEGAEVEGDAWFAGELLAEAADPVEGGPARQVGADLTGASIAYRAERGDLAVTFTLAHLPGVRSGAAVGRRLIAGADGIYDVDAKLGYVPSSAVSPGVVYAMRFAAVDGNTRRVYEIRAGNAGGSTASRRASFELYSCPGLTCSHALTLEGGMGTTGEELVVSVPLFKAFPWLWKEGMQLQAVRASTTIGVPALAPSGDPPHELDAVQLGTVTIPEREVWVGVAPDGVGEGDVAFSTKAELVDGRFSVTLPPAPPDAHVWAKACLGERCSPATSVRM